VTATLERQRTVLPPQEMGQRQLLGELAAALASPAEADASARLIGPDGAQHLLPQETYEILRDVVQAMHRGKAITIAPQHTTLTTQQAAELLGISRPTLVKLLEKGEIPYDQPGRHRKVLLTDVLAYKERRRHSRRAALRRIVAASEEMGLYDKGKD
jgi:excisionase family DNA binding protein